MTDILRDVCDQSEMLSWILFVLAVWAFYRFMNSPDNNLEWFHYITTQNLTTGKYYADLDKLGKATGIVIGSWALLTVSANAKSDFTGFAALMGVYFAFVGGIAGYSAYLRSKSGRIETITTVEPAQASGPTKKTTSTSEPATVITASDKEPRP